MKCIDESRLELNDLNYKILYLVEKLENSIQQYGKSILNKSLCFMNQKCAKYS